MQQVTADDLISEARGWGLSAALAAATIDDTIDALSAAAPTVELVPALAARVTTAIDSLRRRR